MSNGSNKGDSFWFTVFNTKANITIAHGLRLGAQQTLLALANDADKVNSWQKRSEYSRVEYCQWENYIGKLNEDEQQHCYKLYHQLLESFKIHSLHILQIIPFDDMYCRTYSRMKRMHLNFCDETGFSNIPGRLKNYRTIVLCIIEKLLKTAFNFSNTSFIEESLIKQWKLYYEV